MTPVTVTNTEIAPEIRWRRAPGDDGPAHAFRTWGAGWSRSICRAASWTVRLVDAPDADRCVECRALLADRAPGEAVEEWGR